MERWLSGGLVLAGVMLLSGCLAVPGKLIYVGAGNLEARITRDGSVTVRKDVQPVYQMVGTVAPVAAEAVGLRR